MVRTHSLPKRFRKGETASEVKQLVMALLLVVPFLAVAVVGAANLVGTSAAIKVGLGIAALVALSFGFLVAMCVVGSYVYEWVERRLWGDDDTV